MKTIQQLLMLSKNPFYKLTATEQEVLDNFLLSEQEDQASADKKSKKSSKKSNVTVRNIITKVDTYLPASPEEAVERSKSKKDK